MDYRVLLIAPLAALVLGASAAAPRLPDGWLPADHTFLATPSPLPPKGYEIGLDPRPDASGLAKLTVRSVAPLSTQTPSIGAAHQLVHGYGGRRVRLSGQVRAEGVRGWAGLYVGAGDFSLLSDLMMGKPGVEQRLPRGAEAAPGNWQDVSVVFDVPANAPDIDLGLALVGEGQVWARALRFEEVGPQVPVTTTPLVIDWAAARDFFAKSRKAVAQFQPQSLRNAALD